MIQETYRGFSITSEHQGHDGEITGYTVAVDTEAASFLVGEEVGSMAGPFESIEAAKDFIDGDLEGR